MALRLNYARKAHKPYIMALTGNRSIAAPITYVPYNPNLAGVWSVIKESQTLLTYERPSRPMNATTFYKNPYKTGVSSKRMAGERFVYHRPCIVLPLDETVTLRLSLDRRVLFRQVTQQEPLEPLGCRLTRNVSTLVYTLFTILYPSV